MKRYLSLVFLGFGVLASTPYVALAAAPSEFWRGDEELVIRHGSLRAGNNMPVMLEKEFLEQSLEPATVIVVGDILGDGFKIIERGDGERAVLMSDALMDRWLAPQVSYRLKKELLFKKEYCDSSCVDDALGGFGGGFVTGFAGGAVGGGTVGGGIGAYIGGPAGAAAGTGIGAVVGAGVGSVIGGASEATKEYNKCIKEKAEICG